MSGMTNTELETLFKDNLEKFLDIMIQQFPSEKDFKLLQLGLKTKMILASKALKGFAQVIIPHKDMVLNRDENFFLEKCKDLLADTDVDAEQVNHFKRIWTSDDLKEEDRDNLWRWFKLFLNIALRYDQNNKQ
jgi:hypothetical protein